MTNHWFYSKFRKSKRSKKTNRVISGSEIVRASFRRPGRASEDGKCATVLICSVCILANNDYFSKQ